MGATSAKLAIYAMESEASRYFGFEEKTIYYGIEIFEQWFIIIFMYFRGKQDQFYRPVHLIEYYRYVRFFPDGTVLVMTNTDEPAQVVGKLQNGKNRHDVLKGNYK